MRRATIRIEADDPHATALAVAPDNTDEMTTTVESTRSNADGNAVVTRIERETTGGLHSTVDDYVVNVDVAMTVVQHARDANRLTNTDANGFASTTTDDTSETNHESTHE